MPKTFRRLIILQGKRCRLRTRSSGKNSTTYEIRYRRNGFDIHACGKTIELAKANFIEKLKTAKPIESKAGGGSTVPETFNAFSVYYFETFRKPKITEKTYHNDFGRYLKHLKPHFKETPIKNITPPDCKKLLDSVMKSGKAKTAAELYSMMSIIFKGAIAHGIAERSPLAIVQKPRHIKESGKALSREEERLLFDTLTERAYIIAAALALYTGLRPNELSTAKIDGDFITARNSKRKNGKIEYKRIPICDKLRPYLADGLPVLPPVQLFRRRVCAALPGHRLYDLRTTFYTRCDELGVAPPARDAFVGHSGGALTNAYRDLSTEYLLKEGKKLNKW